MRFLLSITAFAILALAGCATPEEKAARAQQKMERKLAEDNSRTNEHRRMMAAENGEVASPRGADILIPDYGRAFDPNRTGVNLSQNFATRGAQTKNYYTDRQYHIDSYAAHDYYGAKANDAAQKKFATGQANTKGKYANPDFGKTADTKTATTKGAWDANKTAPSKELSDARRPYLGPEAKQFGKTTDPKELANWRNGGESTVYSDGAVERASTLKQLSIDDIRDLLNKSK